MKIARTVTLASAVLLATGCAHQRQQAQYDENLVAGSAQASVSGNGANETSVSPAAPANPARVNATASSGQSGSESDNTIVSSVRELLQRDAEIAPVVPNIEITANNGAVQLSGWVQSQEQKNQIGAIAQQAAGVMAVNNQLQALAIPAPQPPAAAQNSPANPVLNPTSSNSKSPPDVYKNGQTSTKATTNTPENTPLNPASAPSKPQRVYQPGTQDHNGPIPDTNNPTH